ALALEHHHVARLPVAEGFGFHQHLGRQQRVHRLGHRRLRYVVNRPRHDRTAPAGNPSLELGPQVGRNGAGDGILDKDELRSREAIEVMSIDVGIEGLAVSRLVPVLPIGRQPGPGCSRALARAAGTAPPPRRQPLRRRTIPAARGTVWKGGPGRSGGSRGPTREPMATTPAERASVRARRAGPGVTVTDSSYNL